MAANKFAFVDTAVDQFLHLQKLVIRSALHLDQVGHFRDLGDLAEPFAKPFASREGESHSAVPWP